MLALVLENIAYHAIIAMDEVVYLVQLCLYYFRGFRRLLFRLLDKAIRDSLIIAVLIVEKNTVRLASITTRSTNLLDVICHADRCIEVHDKFNIGDINTHRERRG